MVREMIEILGVTHYDWRDPAGKLTPKTQVTWRDEKDVVHITVLDGTLRDESRIEREVRRPRRR